MAAASLQLAHVVRLPAQQDGDDVYTFKVESASVAGADLFAAALSDGSVRVFTKAHLSQCATLAPHTGVIQDIHFLKQSTHLLVSCCDDGKCTLWDVRTSRPAQQLDAGDTLFCCDVDARDTMLVGGGAAALYFWDLRSKSLLGKYEDSHSDDVVQVTFDKFAPTKLFSGGIDQLINVFDVSIRGEEDALIGVLNADDDIHKFGVFGQQGQFLYCLSQTERVSLWNAQSLDRIAHFDNAREQCGVDNFIGGHYDQATQRLYLMGASNGGRVVLINATTAALQPIVAMDGAHSGRLRCMEWTNVLLTAGEDSRICVWNPGAAVVPAAASAAPV